MADPMTESNAQGDAELIRQVLLHWGPVPSGPVSRSREQPTMRADQYAVELACRLATATAALKESDETWIMFDDDSAPLKKATCEAMTRAIEKARQRLRGVAYDYTKDIDQHPDVGGKSYPPSLTTRSEKP